MFSFSFVDIFFKNKIPPSVMLNIWLNGWESNKIVRQSLFDFYQLITNSRIFVRVNYSFFCFFYLSYKKNSTLFDGLIFSNRFCTCKLASFFHLHLLLEQLFSSLALCFASFGCFVSRICLQARFCQCLIAIYEHKWKFLSI